MSMHNMRIIAVAALALISAGALLTTSCRENIGPEPTPTGQLSFYVSDTLEALPESRSGASPVRTWYEPVKLEGTEKMWLHTSVTSGIHLPEDTSSSSSAPATKSDRVENIGGFHQAIGLFGYSYPTGQRSDLSGRTPDFLYDVKATKGTVSGTSASYTTEGKYYIPAAGTDVTVFGYAPHNCYLLDKPAEATDGVPKFNYTVDYYPVNHADLCITSGTEIKGGSADGQVSLNFKHVLTAIRFQAEAGVDQGTITDIRIKGVKAQGTYTPDLQQNGNGTWSLTNEEREIYMNDHHGSFPGVSVGGGSVVDITKGLVFFMLPQTLGPKAEIIIKFRSTSGTESSINVPISGQTWPQGSTVTYTIKSSSVVFDVVRADGTKDPLNCNYKGTTFNFNITAKRGSTDLPIVVQYRYPNGNGTYSAWQTDKLAMVTDATPTVANGQILKTFSLGIREAEVLSDSDQALRNRGNNATTDEYLAGYYENEQSSNCYVITCPGNFQFPIAYPNAYRGQSQSYGGTAITNAYSWDEFQFSDGSTMKGADYQRMRLISGAVKAEILWQDQANLIQNVYVNNERYVYFSVPKATIREGNAVIVVKNSQGTILWSWHIWVTSKSIADSWIDLGNGYSLLDRPLGYVNAGKRVWEQTLDREVRFVLAEEKDMQDAPHSVTYKINRTGHEVSTPGWYPLYQWGRKDPLYPGYVNAIGFGEDKDLFWGPSGAQTMTMGLTTPGATIRYPATISSSTGYLDHKQKGNNLNIYWYGNVDKNDYQSSLNNAPKTVSTKTVYDPTPAGCSVPSITAYEAMTTSSGSFTYLTVYQHLNLNQIATYSLLFKNVRVPFAGFRSSGSFNFEYAMLGINLWTFNARTARGGNGVAMVVNVGGNQPLSSGTVQQLQGTTRQDRSPLNCYPIIPMKKN